MSENQGEGAGNTSYGGDTTDTTNNTGTRTWGDTLGTVTTNTNGDISWNYNNGGSGNSNDPSTWSGNQGDMSPSGNTLGSVDYQKQLAAMFDKNNPEFGENLKAMQTANQQATQWAGGLGSMYGNSPSDNSDQQNEDAGHALNMANIYGVSDPSLAHRLGIYQGFSFDKETPAMRDDRMGLVNNVIGGIGQASLNAAMPGALRVGLAGLSAYNGYQKDHNLQAAAGNVLGAMPGYFGAAGQALQGNYGQAFTGAAMRNGLNGMEASLGGLGIDAAMGKNVATPGYGLAGMYVGNQLGGPVGGVFGSQLGRTISHLRGNK